MNKNFLLIFFFLISIRNYADETNIIFDVDSSMNETISFIPIESSNEKILLETTIFYPTTPAPWPLAIINHGTDGGMPSFHQEKRSRPIELAKFFMKRGYLVVAPMRQGYAQSGGKPNTVKDNGCEDAKYAISNAKDFKNIVDFFILSGQAKKDQILVIGGSTGGLVSLGIGASEFQSKIQGIINISGGVKPDKPCNWDVELIKAGSELGSLTKIPSLWLYTEDDKWFPPSVSKPFFENYKKAGADATLKLYKKGGHGFAWNKDNLSLWTSDVELFLAKIKLPNH